MPAKTGSLHSPLLERPADLSLLVLACLPTRPHTSENQGDNDNDQNERADAQRNITSHGDAPHALNSEHFDTDISSLLA
jgi:hypothetical protein